jgi:hypothetical protein
MKLSTIQYQGVRVFRFCKFDEPGLALGGQMTDLGYRTDSYSVGIEPIDRLLMPCGCYSHVTGIGQHIDFSGRLIFEGKLCATFEHVLSAVFI